MSDIVWAINPGRESLLDLTRRMRQHAEEMFTVARASRCEFERAGPAAATSGSSMDVRRDLLLIFKEAVSNAARHSRLLGVSASICSVARIAVDADGDATTATGFDTSVESDGQGSDAAYGGAAAHGCKGQIAHHL